MDYSMMPPPQSTSCASGVVVGSVSGDFSGAGGGGGHFSGGDSSQGQLFNSEQNQKTSQNGTQFASGQYKPHFSGRAHVNRPPPISIPQTYFRDTMTQSPAPHYADHQQTPHHIAASPHHVSSPMVNHGSHIEQPSQRVLQSPHLQQTTHILHRQASAPHLVQSPHIAQSPHLTNYNTAGEMSPRPTPAHMQQNLYTDRNNSPLSHSGTPYESIASPIHHHKPRHFSESSQSPHPYNHPSLPPTQVHLYNNNPPNPSSHHFTADPSPSPHHFNDPNPSPHHFNDPNPSPFNDQGPHRSTYLDTSQPGTPVAPAYSHPGTPAGYVDSPHQHLSPHPTRSAYQHFFGPNLPLPVNGGATNSNGGDNSALDLVSTGAGGGQFSQQNSTDSSQHQAGAMLHAGGQGDAMLSAINLNPQESEASGLQDTQSSHAENAMDTDWPNTPQKLKSAPSASSSFNLFDSASNPPGVDELLSQATDFIASNNLSLSDGM